MGPDPSGCPFKATTNVPTGWQEFFNTNTGTNPGAATAQVFQSPSPPNGLSNRIGVNTNQANFSSFDLQSVIQHEVGHILGFAHSQNRNNPGPCAGTGGTTTTCPVMWPFLNASVTRRTFDGDDRQAISLFYNQWNLKQGFALDVAAGGSSGSPMIYATSSDNSLFFFTPSISPPWTQILADAVAIAVDDGGLPWAVSSDGSIWQGSGTDPTSFFFTWNARSFNSLANDIGASGGQVWIISKTPASGAPGNFVVQQLSGSTWSSANGGVGNRITVDWAGRPWVLQTNGNVWRRYGTNDTIDQTGGASPTWQQLNQLNQPQQGQAACGTDIGAGRDHSVWLVGCNQSGSDFGMWIWDEQPVLAGSAPQEAQFLPADGSGVRVAGSPDGRAWAVQANGNVFRRSINSSQQ